MLHLSGLSTLKKIKMRFINKQHTPPANWPTFFNGVTQYAANSNARRILETEQNNLCAYCQRNLGQSSSTIEHFIPNSQNSNFSTSYFNLIAACSRQANDHAGGIGHCNEFRGTAILPPFIFYANCKTTINSLNPYFKANEDGTIQARKHEGRVRPLTAETTKAAEAFIEHLNLKDNRLIKDRRDAITSLVNTAKRNAPRYQAQFWELQANYYCLPNSPKPFSEFLALYINEYKRGIITLTP